MKKYFKGIVVMAILMAAFIAPTFAQEVEAVIEDSFLMDFLASNIEAIGLIVTWLVLRLIPTKWRDPILMVINWLISLIPDKKAGGGSHK